jgi:hypothetical protein
MKYINTKIEDFISEGRFTRISEPVQVDWEDIKGTTRNRKEFWEKDEMSDIVEFLESKGYRNEDGETNWDDTPWIYLVNQFHVGMTFLHFFITAQKFKPHQNMKGKKNMNPYWFYIVKCTDGLFYVTIHQDESEDDDDDEYFEDFVEYWECNGFDSLIIFLNRHLS